MRKIIIRISKILFVLLIMLGMTSVTFAKSVDVVNPPDLETNKGLLERIQDEMEEKAKEIVSEIISDTAEDGAILAAELIKDAAENSDDNNSTPITTGEIVKDGGQTKVVIDGQEYTAYCIDKGMKGGYKKWVPSDEDHFTYDFPENADIKITDYCDAGCAYCHENSTIKGVHGDLRRIEKTLDSLHAGTEMAVGGGNALAHPDLIWFLEKLKSRGVLANITINQKHLRPYKDLICKLVACFLSTTRIMFVVSLFNVLYSVVLIMPVW